MEEFQELLASPPSSWESQISSLPYFATVFWGGAEKLGDSVDLYFTYSHIIHTYIMY